MKLQKYFSTTPARHIEIKYSPETSEATIQDLYDLHILLSLEEGSSCDIEELARDLNFEDQVIKWFKGAHLLKDNAIDVFCELAMSDFEKTRRKS